MNNKTETPLEIMKELVEKLKVWINDDSMFFRCRSEIETAIEIFENELEFLNNLDLHLSKMSNQWIYSMRIHDRINNLKQAIQKGKETIK